MSYFLTHSDNLLIGVFRLLTFKVTVDVAGLISITFVTLFDSSVSLALVLSS